MAEPHVALQVFSRLHKDLFNDSFTSIYTSIQAYYRKHGTIPSIDALALESSRNARLSQALSVLAATPMPQVDIMHAISVLESEFTQDLLLSLLETTVLKDITMLDTDEIIDRVGSIALKLEEKIKYSNNVLDANQISVFEEKGRTQLNLIPLGISNVFDAYSGGLGRTEVMFVGGYRGTGKSVLCSNAQVNQHAAGFVAPYISIEMQAGEVLKRNLAIMSGVSALDIRKQILRDQAIQQLAAARAGMFHGGLEYLQQYVNANTVVEMSDFFEFDQRLMEEFQLITPMPIIHDPTITVSKVDAVFRRFSSEYGDKATLAILDYLNQVRIDGAKDIDMYDWASQMVIGKAFKNTCVEANMAGISPYQMDAAGNARMSRGILDSCDIAANLNAAKNDQDKGAMLIELVKVRSMAATKLMPEVDWKSLRIKGNTELTLNDINEMEAEFVLPLDKGQPAKQEKRAPSKPKGSEESADI